MPKRNFGTLDELKANLHRQGATLVELEAKKVPCILVSPQDYEDIMQKLYGKTVRAEPMLDIFHDGRHVFVDIQIKFVGSDYDKNYLFYANEMLEFFEALADSGLIAIAPDGRGYSSEERIFMIQLAKRDGVEKALEIIRSNSRRKSGTVNNGDRPN